jgi:hypothetical protein
VATSTQSAPVLPSRGVVVSVSSVVDLDVDDWYRQLRGEIAGSSSVELATYVYDDTGVQGALLKRLAGPAAFTVTMHIDAEMFEGGVPKLQKSRLKALHTAGARIWICRGVLPRGSFHGRAVVIGSDVLYTGSANLTQKSHSNEEFCYRMCGSVAQRMLRRLVDVRRRGKLWNGS